MTINREIKNIATQYPEEKTAFWVESYPNSEK